MIRKNESVLVIRYNEYRQYSFFKEHCQILDDVNYVWIHKMGREIPESSLKKFCENGGHILFKSPKKNGEHYYYAHFVECKNGKLNDKKAYPNYYQEMIEDIGGLYECTLDGTWFKVDYLHEMNNNDVEKIVLEKNGKHISEVIKSTRTTTLHAASVDDIFV